MRVLVLHNRYKYPGGEDIVVQQEAALLRESGADVQLFEVDNDGILNWRSQVSAAINTIYSSTMRSHVSTIVKRFRPDIMHVHNFMPRLSPSVYDAARDSRCAVVQTLHNYRLLCANAQLFYNNQPCNDCAGRAFGWPAVARRCYRNSAAGSVVLAGMTAWHRARGTWKTRVHRYIVLTQFARELFAKSGMIPADRMFVKPNSAEDDGVGHGDGNYLLYVGRLSIEKGIRTLLSAAQQGDGLPIPLKVVGAGPLVDEVRAAERAGTIEYLGERSRVEVKRLMKNATALVFPSIWYEGFPLVLTEAFSAGLPVIASRLGAGAEIVTHDRTGLLAEPSCAEEFQGAARRIISTPELRTTLGRNARTAYEERYTPHANLRMLLQVYEDARVSVNESPRGQLTQKEYQQ